jgi:hypothetical protein
MRTVKPFDTYIGIIIISSSHKCNNNNNNNNNNNKEEVVQSVFHNFSPSLPVSLILCPISQCGTLSQMVSVHGFAEVA